MSLRAGAAQRDISPRKPVQLFGYPHVRRIGEGSHDPLLVSALYIKDGPSALFLMAVDLLFLDTPVARRFRRKVASALELPEAAVFISCTHTHSGPVSAEARLLFGDDDPSCVLPDPAYLDFVELRLVEAARAAAASCVPAELAWTSATVRGVGGNRHDPAGIADPECSILAVRRQDNHSLLALATVYAMHPTVLHEDSALVSSDFPHYARQELRERFGNALTVVYHTGPCGNQSPRHVVKAQTFEEAERLGRLLGNTVAEAVGRLEAGDYTQEAALGARLLAVDLPRRALPARAEALATLDAYRREYRRLIECGAVRADSRTAECAVFGAEKLVALAGARESGFLDELLDTALPADVQVVRIGSRVLAGFPGECFVEYGLALKAAGIGIVPVAYVNGTLLGYVVTREAVAAGGYEAAGRVFEPEAGDRLVEVAIAGARKL